jgi:hypothetical protein
MRQNVHVYKIISIDAKKTGHDKIRICSNYLSICCGNSNYVVKRNDDLAILGLSNRRSKLVKLKKALLLMGISIQTSLIAE